MNRAQPSARLEPVATLAILSQSSPEAQFSSSESKFHTLAARSGSQINAHPETYCKTRHRWGSATAWLQS